MANTGLTRWNPTREITSMRDVVERLFNDSFFRPYRLTEGWSGIGFGLSMDIYEEGDNYIVEGALPGVRPENVDISLQGNTLTIKGSMPQLQEQEGRNYLLRELSAGGEFVRTITLPVEVNADQVQATFEHGMLHLVLPKSPAYQARRIQVTSKSGK